MADRFLCLKDPAAPKVMTDMEIRRTRTHIMFRTKVEEWAEFEESRGKFRRIISTPPPDEAGTVPYVNGYEEIDGKLYQTWIKR